MNKNLILFLIALHIFINCQWINHMDWEYFGQKSPGNTPRLFAPELTNHLFHSSPTFSPDGTEIYWSEIGKNDNESHNIYYVKYKDGKWSDPAVASFSSRSHDDQPFITYDGQKLFFASRRPKTPKDEESWDLWFCTRTDDSWSEPALVNDRIGFWTPSVTHNGTLYFMDVIQDAISRDYKENAVGIFRSELVNGNYAAPELLPEQINSKKYHDWTPFIGPDESYLIFSSHRKGGYGQGDLYISFSDENGQWNDPVNMGSAINTDKQERFPGISPDGKYLFFTRWLGPPHFHDLYWVRIGIIDSLKNNLANTKKKLENN